MNSSSFTDLAETTAQRYLSSGRFVHGFVRGKLLYDPMFKQILALKLPPEHGSILDLGCGRGILLSLITTASEILDSPMLKLALYGIEIRQKDSRIARQALGKSASIVTGDICKASLPASDLVLLLDVLFYLEADQQEALLTKVKEIIQPNGLLLIREADAANGWRFSYTRVIERICAVFRLNWRQYPHYRSRQEWQKLLESLNFKVEIVPMSQGTLFANFLFIARPCEKHNPFNNIVS